MICHHEKCDREFVPHGVQRYCSRRCSERASSMRYHKRHYKPKTSRAICRECGREFERRRHNHLVCGAECRAARRREWERRRVRDGGVPEQRKITDLRRCACGGLIIVGNPDQHICDRLPTVDEIAVRRQVQTVVHGVAQFAAYVADC